jgi:hypothetical protein
MTFFDILKTVKSKCVSLFIRASSFYQTTRILIDDSKILTTMWGIIRFLYNYMIYGLINHVNVGNVTYLRECRSLIYRPENYRSNRDIISNNESDNDDIIIEDVGEPIEKTSTIYSMNMMFMGKMYKILIPSNPLIIDDNDVIVYVERDKFDTIIGIKNDNEEEEELVWISEYRGPNGNFYSNVIHPKMFGYDSFRFEDFDEEYMTVSTNFIVIN